MKGSATARDILGNAATHRVDPRWRKHFDRLRAMREHLVERRSDFLRNGVSTDDANLTESPASRASDEYEAGAAFGLLSTDQDALNEIDQALERIRDGTYGMCEMTGQPIPDDRLTAIPWTRFAKDVEDRLEREANARKPKHIF